MTDLTQLPNKQSTDVEDAEVIEESTSNNAKPAKTGVLWFVTLVNLIILILICVAAYWYYNQVSNAESSKQSEVLTLQQSMQKQSSSLQGNINQLKQATESLENKLIANEESNQQGLSNIKQSINDVQANIDNNEIATRALTKRLAELSGRRPSDWLLAEANYLVNMASRKLYLESDVRTAVTLLQEADARLDDLSDPSLFPVRALISADIQTLSQINTISTNSIALTLAGMLPRVAELPLDKLQLPESNKAIDTNLSEDISDWQQNLSKVWDSLVGDLFSIDYVDKPLEPYLAERQQWLIEQQLKHAITVAQSAALDEQLELYRSAIAQAMSLLVEHYQIESPLVSQFLVALQELQNTDFSRDLPNKLSSQASLKDILDQRIKALYNNSTANEQETSGNPL